MSRAEGMLLLSVKSREKVVLERKMMLFRRNAVNRPD